MCLDICGKLCCIGNLFLILQLFLIVFYALQNFLRLPPFGRIHDDRVLNNISEDLVHLLERLLIIFEMDDIEYFVRVIASKHGLQGDHLIENHSQRPQICPEIVLSFNALRRRVANRQELSG